MPQGWEDLPTALGIPKARGAVRAGGGDVASIRAEASVINPVSAPMFERCHQRFSRASLPDSGRAVFASTDDIAPVGTEGRVQNFVRMAIVGMPAKGVNRFAGDSVPDKDICIGRCCNQ